MMNTRILAASATALAVAFAAAACGGTDTAATDGTATATTTVAAPEIEDTDAHNQADVMFARMMIPHHAQAVEMSDLILAKDGVPEAVAALAEQIKAAQGPEIDQMSAWLEEWGWPAPMRDMPGMDGDTPGMDGGMPGMHGDMPGMTSAPGMDGMPGDMPGMHGDMPGMEGMMSAEDMQALADAEGTDAARLFLTQMIVHHEGAITMAQSEVENGKFPAAVQLALDIIDAQQQEIDTMRELLTTL